MLLKLNHIFSLLSKTNIAKVLGEYETCEKREQKNQRAYQIQDTQLSFPP